VAVNDMVRFGLGLCLPAVTAGAQSLERIQTLAAGFPISDHRLVDVDADGRVDLLLVAADGRVRVHRHDGKQFSEEMNVTLTLPRADHALVAWADVLGRGRPQLVVANPDGVVAFAPTADGHLGGDGVVLSRRARFRLRTGQPTFAEFLRDLNGDQRLDLVMPEGERCGLWLQTAGEDGAIGFREAGSIPVQLGHGRSIAAKALSDRLQESFTIPQLMIRDQNGDGRPDLMVVEGQRRGFHLQNDDGTLPEQPTVVLDLELFKDTTPPASIVPGRTLAGGDQAQQSSRDLDGDGIPDWVIAHRRKVWVFHGGSKGPQFAEPTAVFRVHDDVTALLLVNLDADQRPDLLVLRVQVPTVASLLLGLLGEWDVEIAALGYRNGDGKKFLPDPAWRSTTTIRLPSLLSVIRDPQAIVGKFTDVGKEFRWALSGDLDGDGHGDALVVSEDETVCEVWRGSAEQDRSLGKVTLDGTLRDVLFQQQDKVWTIDRLLEWLRGMAEQRVARLSRNEPAQARMSLRSSDGFTLLDLQLVDLDGDGSAELVLRYETRAGGEAHFDVVAWRD
jgi:hypothetical protein